jgi:hypothetical protein
LRPRWHEWVITLSIVALGATGLVSIWGAELLSLAHTLGL